MTHRLCTAALMLSLTLLGCGDKDDDTGEDSSTGGGGDTTLTPQEGSWDSDEGSLVSDECGIFGDDEDTGDGGEDDPATLAMTGEDTFTMTFPDDDLTDQVSCTLTDDNGTFTCDPFSQQIDWGEESGLDALGTMTFTMSGALSSETAGTMSMAVELTCAGEDCDTVAEYAEITFPCSAEMSFNIMYAG